jgi:hypothetical protein
MNLRFSLLSLVVFTTYSALACAALARPGTGWLSLIVTCTAAAAGVQILRAALLDGERRAAAIGWILFAGAYIALFAGPWLSQHLAPHLLTSKGAALALQRLQQQGAMPLASYDPPADFSGMWIDPGYVNVQGSALSLLVAGRVDTSASSAGLLPLTAHWLFVWIAATAGSTLAAGLFRRQQLTASGNFKATIVA